MASGTYQGVVGDVPTCIKCPAPSTTVSAGKTSCYTCTEGFASRSLLRACAVRT